MDELLSELKKDRALLRERIRRGVLKEVGACADAGHYYDQEGMVLEVLNQSSELIKGHQDVPPKWWVYVMRSQEPVLSDKDLFIFLSAIDAIRNGLSVGQGQGQG